MTTARVVSPRTAIALIVATVLALAMMAVGVQAKASRDGARFEALVGNTLTGEAGAIRGVPAGGLPWVLDRGEARISDGSQIDVRVEGLVLAAGDNAGTNPQPEFRAIVSCLTHDTHAVENRTSAPAPATPEGDARIRDVLDLPDPCLAPIVFVTNAAGTSWFAVSGF
ncbi:MAG: hypothetical protein GEU81_07905 [Nitriliruptorales bacterium]|nr:hypothetical protein [Nitriliruptorales bacterium]